jgi:CRP-like cAMP-binding protein
LTSGVGTGNTRLPAVLLPRRSHRPLVPAVSDSNFAVFAGAPPPLVSPTIEKLPLREFAAGETVLRENDPNDRVFLIQTGELEVWKGEPNQPTGVRVARLKAGECFGEMSALNSAPASATVVASVPTVVRTMALGDLPSDNGMKEAVTLNLARTLVRRLSTANQDIQEKHRREIDAMKLIAAASAFITRILTVLTLYMFSLPFVPMLVALIPTNTLISFLYIVVFGWVVLNFMYAHPHLRTQAWFMTLAQWPRQLGRAVLWAIPLCLIFTAIKLSIMHARPGEFHFFEPMMAVRRHAPMNFPLWAALALAYTALCFAQEFIRCAVQGTLELINTASSTGGHWKAILLSDVVFMAVHLHLGPAFASQAFLGGIFFGYEFYRERSFLSTATTHAIVGVFAVFICGIPR